MSIVQIHFKNAFYMQQPKLLIHHPPVTHLDFKQALYVYMYYLYVVKIFLFLSKNIIKLDENISNTW